MKRMNWLLGAAVALAIAAGCTDMTHQQQGTLSGGVMGAAAGAGIAAIAGGDAWTGAAIGGIAGLIAGDMHGHRRQQQSRRRPHDWW
jgi:hypothetical protein